MRLAFDGASKEARLVGENKRNSHYNFFFGNERVRWQTNVATFSSLLYRELYDGVDVRVREEAGRLEYDLLLAPKADLEQVIISCAGTKSLEIAKDGALLLHTAKGPLRQTPPMTSEVQPDGTRRAVECRFRTIGENRYGFEVPKRDPKLALVIDPGLEWSTYLGGSGAEALDAVALARDGSGDVLVAGYMNSPDFPGFNDPNFTGFQNKVFVARLSGDGTTLSWATLLGGWSSQVLYRGLAAAVDGGAAIVGDTSSPDFPTTPGAFDRTLNFGDAFVARVNAAGGLVFSTFLGGSGSDQAYACGFDPAGNLIVGGNTSSPDFPVTAGAFDTTYNVPNAQNRGGAPGDMFITRFNASGAVTYSTFLGGPSLDWMEDLVVDSQGFVTVVGWVTGNLDQTFVTTADAFDRTWNGNQDAVLARLKLDGLGAADLKYSTLIGGASDDNFFSVTVDPVDPTFVTAVGMSWSDNFPATPGVFKTTNPIFSSLFPSQAAIVTRFHLPAGGPNTLVWSTYLGPPGPAANIRATSVAVNSVGEPIVVGLMGDGNYPTTRGAFDRTPEGILNRGGDFIARLSANAAQLNYSSFFGGTAGDVDSFLISPAVAYVGGNTVIIAGSTTSADFPVTAGVFDTVLSPLDGDGSDGFISRFTTDPDASGDLTVGTPTPLSPPNGATFPSGTLMARLQWSAVPDPSGIDGYEFQISAEPAFTNATPGVSHTTDVIMPPTGTGKQGIGLRTWYWRVRAYDRAGNIGAWSTTSTFTLDAPNPPPSVTFAYSYPLSVVGGSSAVGAVYLDRPAPAGGLTVTPVVRYNKNRGFFAPNIPIPVTVPASLTVPAGATSAEFPITTVAVPNSVAVDIICLVNGVGADTILGVSPPGAIETSDLVIQPATVGGGHASTGTVTIKQTAPPGGFVVNLRTSHPQAARVPATVTVPAGSRSATFPITTFAVPFGIDSYVDAFTASGLERQYIFVKPAGEPALSSLALNPTTVTGGALVTGTITLSGLEPVATWPAFDGAEVSIYASDPNLIATSPFAYVPSGNNSATFTFSVLSVPTNTTANIFASYDGVTLSKPLTMNAGPTVTISNVTLNVTTLTGGQGGIAWVNLNAPTPGGIVVTLSASDPILYFDAPTLVIYPNEASSMIGFLTQATSNNAVVNITARYGNSSASAPVTVNATTSANLWVTGVTLNPNSVPGGGSATGTVTINAPAPAGGAVVQLDSSDTTVANVPATVAVPAGATSANFTITTASVSSSTMVLIYGLLNLSQSAALTVTAAPAPPPTPGTPSLLSPANKATPAQPVAFDWSDVSAAVSYTIQIDDSSTISSPFVASQSVTVSQTTVSGLPNKQLWWRVRGVNSAGVAGSWSSTRTFTPQAAPSAPTLSSVTLNPTSVVGGNTSQGTVTLTSAAPSGGAVVSLSSANTAVATVSANVTVAAGASTATFTVTTVSVPANNSVAISAVYSGVTRTATLTVTAPPPPASLSSVALNPTSVVGGNTSQGTVTLTSAAPSGGAVVTLTSANTSVASAPVSVTVPAGSTSASFNLTTVSVTSSTTVAISATYSGVTKTATLTVTPASTATLSSLTLNPTTVKGGDDSIGTVTLSAPAPTGGALVNLSSSDTSVATVPSSVTVSAGSTSGTFTVTTGRIDSNRSVTISATGSGVTKTAVLNVTGGR